MTTHAHSVDLGKIWSSLRAEAQYLKTKEPTLSPLVHSNILAEPTILPSLAKILSSRLATPEISMRTLHGVFMNVYQAEPTLEETALLDLLAAMENNPAAPDHITPFLFFKGYHALQSYRVAHKLWLQGRTHFALHLQNRISDLFAVDIHPAARIGNGVMMDHATGIVIGETATVGNNVLFFHGVTLGGKGTATGDRHPKIGNGVHLGAGSIVLGPVRVGDNARVAAGSVVVNDVETGTTVAGVPAKPLHKQ